MNKKSASEIQNLLIAMVLSVLILSYWEYFIEGPRKKAEEIAGKRQAQEQIVTQQQQVQELKTEPKSKEEWLGASPRVRISTPSLHGSIALKGLRFDDLTLANYRQTLDPNSPEVVLFTPGGDTDAYFAEFGWTAPADGKIQVPVPDTVWKSDVQTLEPAHPATFTWKNDQGAVFTVKITLNEKYLFDVTQSAVDAAGKPLILPHYAYINRVYDAKTHTALGIIHEGPLGVFDGTLQEAPYKKLTEDKEQAFETSTGWMGMSDKYWLSAIIPPDGNSFSGRFSYYTSKGREHYQTDYLSAPTGEITLHFFAGAKELAVLDDYSARYHIPLFDRAVDFGRLWFLTEPIFHALAWFYALLGNFGVAILLLTIIVKLCLFPLAYKQFRAMDQMKKLQPKMNDIRERCKDDKVKLNQEIIALYKREKVNPASGCLPLFIQIPIFYSLYKVLYVTIEMRHAPFFGWIHDLSAPDPTNLLTLFGLFPWSAPAFLHIAIWPLIMSATMFIQQMQSPPPPDPMQAKMMKAMPLVLFFVFANAPAGLVIYWSWSNTITIVQQYIIRKRHEKD